MDARTLKKEDLQKETVYCLNDDNETEVPKEDTIQGAPVRQLLPGGGRQTRVCTGSVGRCFSQFWRHDHGRDHEALGPKLSSSVASEAGSAWVLHLSLTCPPVTGLNTWFYFKV